MTYWGVENLDAALKHFTRVGANLTTAAQDVGEGIRVATVADPFGNLVGLIENPNFKT